MPIKSFRGMLADGGQDTILLHTPDGSIGYRIIKFQLMPKEPGEEHHEHTVKIYKIQQTTVDNTIDFNDQTLLGAAYYQDAASQDNPSSRDIIFDTEIFNQDLYITGFDSVGAVPINYYIELEQFKLDLNENTVATLKDIRNQA